MHQAVVKRAYVVLGGDWDTGLSEDSPLVDFVIEQERRDARFGFAVYNGPVDGGPLRGIGAVVKRAG